MLRSRRALGRLPGAVAPSSSLPTITSRRHPLVQACREARTGGPGQPLLIDGWHLLVEAVQAGLAVDAVAVSRPSDEAAAARALELLVSAGAQVVRATDDVVQAMSPVRTASGVVALARRPPLALARVLAPAPALVLVAVDVQDPGNLGALVRTAEAAGATGLVAAGVSADPLGWKALRASMGSAFRLPLAREADTAAALEALAAAGVALVALVPRGGARLDDVDARRPLALVVGGEGPGLSQALAARADARVTLPMRRPVESLNVAVAGALALYGLAARREAR